MSSNWTPTTNLLHLRRFGKLQEELAELAAVAARCITQGIDEVDPGTGKLNRHRLEEELADVLAQCQITVRLLDLNSDAIHDRKLRKQVMMMRWESDIAERSGQPWSNP